MVLELAHMTVRLQGNGREVMPSLNGQAEAALFVEDASRARDFYQHVLGLQKLQESEVGCVFAVAKEQALLLVASSPSASTHLTQPQLTFRPHESSA